MSNLFGAELYRWRRSKDFYCLLFAAVATVVLVWMSFWFAEQINTGQMENGAMGVTVSEESIDRGESMFEQYTILDLVQSFVGGGVAHIFVVIAACIWLTGGYTNGAVKNVVGKGYTRNSIFLVKYVSAVLVSAVLNLITIIALILMGMVVMGTERVDGQFWINCLAYTGIELMLGAAFGGLIVAVSEFARNMAVGISVSIFLALFSGLAAKGLDAVFGLMGTGFRVSDYWLTCAIENCPVEGIGKDFVCRALLVTVIWTVLSLFVGMVHFHEADI